MSLNAVLANAYSGITTNQAALRVTSNNIANSNTEGYARQRADIVSQLAGGRGAGVTVEQIVRVVDQFLEAAEGDAQSSAAEATVIREYHDRVQSLLGRPDSETSLTARLDTALASLNTISIDPADSLRRQGLVSDLDAFLRDISRLATDIQRLRVEASNQMAEQVTLANQALEQIARLNPQITKAQLGQSETGPLEDQRDRAIRELAQIVDIRVSTASNGSVRIATSNGITLLDDTIRVLSYNSPGAGDPFTEFPQITIQRRNSLTGALEPGLTAIDDALGGGRLQGLLEVRDTELPAIADSLGELARVFADEINAVHNANVSIPSPTQLAGRATGLVGTDLAHLTGVADFAVVNADGDVVARTSIDFSALGAGATMNDVITAINTGLGGAATAALSADGNLSLTSTSLANGVVVAPDDANPAQRAGRGFAHFFGLNDLVTSAIPTHYETGFRATDPHGFTVGDTVQFEVRARDGRSLRTVDITIGGTTFGDILGQLNDPLGLGGYYDFTLSSTGELQVTPLPGFGEPQLISRQDVTQRGGTNGISFTELFGLRRGTASAIATDIQVNPEIENNPEFLSLGLYDRTALVGERAITVGDGRGAARLADIQLAEAQFDAAGELQALDTTLTQYAAFVVGNAAVMAENAASQEQDTRALQITVTQRRQDISGVNIDEELSQMVVFQNAYNASARLITTAQQMFDQLLQVV
ncbi:MAG: flagellar hook-associated protein FlgK [Pseudomonadota bacterium]